MGKEPAGWLSPVSSGQLFSIQVETSNGWCPSRSILGQTLGHIFINDMGSDIESTHKFEDDAKLSDAVVSLEGWNAVQRVCDRPEKWTNMSTIEFKKGKCKVLHLVRRSP